jgi:hypothetical protein
MGVRMDGSRWVVCGYEFILGKGKELEVIICGARVN